MVYGSRLTVSGLGFGVEEGLGCRGCELRYLVSSIRLCVDLWDMDAASAREEAEEGEAAAAPAAAAPDSSSRRRSACITAAEERAIFEVPTSPLSVSPLTLLSHKIQKIDLRWRNVFRTKRTPRQHTNSQCWADN